MMASKELGGEEAGRVLYTVGRGVLWHFFRYTSDPPAAHSRESCRACRVTQVQLQGPVGRACARMSGPLWSPSASPAPPPAAPGPSVERRVPAADGSWCVSEPRTLESHPNRCIANRTGSPSPRHPAPPRPLRHILRLPLILESKPRAPASLESVLRASRGMCGPSRSGLARILCNAAYRIFLSFTVYKRTPRPPFYFGAGA